MSDATTPRNGFETPAERKHPPVRTIEDVIVFKLARLVGVNERAGQGWSETLFDLSLNEWRLLALLQAHAPARAGDLSQKLLMDKSQLSRVIRELSGKKLLSSKADPQDARAVVLSLTAKGQARYSEMIGHVLQRNERVLDPLSALEVQVLNGMLDRLLSHNLAMLDQSST